MKIYVNRKPVDGPWGGGNKTLKSLVNELDTAVFNLDDDVDVIFCVDPRPNEKGLWYQDYLNHKVKFGSKIIQRVGDVGTHGKPDLTDLIKQSIQYSDMCIFPSQWALEYVNASDNSIVIPNGPVSDFYEFRNTNEKVTRPIKIVTHHWSDNDKKGFDVYSSFREYIGEKYMFTYIGRYSNKYSREGVDYVDPLDTDELKTLLPAHDIYLTASKEEAGANHVLEAMACGLPVVYRSGGGSIDEYCLEQFGGSSYENISDLNGVLNSVVENYDTYKKKVLSYQRNNNDLVKEYLEIINEYRPE
jgi:hypothetical protein